MEINMKKNEKFLLMLMIISFLLLIIRPTYVLGNASEPPSVVILVNNPPDDFSITMVSGDNHIEASKRKLAWENYYLFYKRDLNYSNGYKFKAVSNGEHFEFTIHDSLTSYNNVYTLNVSKRELSLGKYPFRTVILVSIRVLLTLLVEGIIFWLFGFRNKSSWLAFLVINLITQGLLNIWLSIEASPMPSYSILFVLIIGEIFVFLTEVIMLPKFIDEYKKIHVRLYAIVANFLSLVVGFYIIPKLPI
jgi:hypothetical protein